MSDSEEGRPKSGIDRRTLIKRGAIVGGLVWATPVVQSLTTPAHAQTVSELCAVCVDVNNPGTADDAHWIPTPSAPCCDCIAAANTIANPIQRAFAIVTCVLFSTSCNPGDAIPGLCP